MQVQKRNEREPWGGARLDDAVGELDGVEEVSSRRGVDPSVR